MDYMQLKPMVTSGEAYDRYESYLRAMKETAVLNLCSATDPHEMYRQQGHIACLTQLLNLKSRIQADERPNVYPFSKDKM